MVEKAITVSKDIEQLRDGIDQILKTCVMDKEELNYKEKELQDLLHEIEFAESLDRKYQKNFISKLQYHRRDRRRLKDELFLIEPVARLLNEKYPNLINDLNKALGKCRKDEESLKSRIYKPRTTVLKELLENAEARGGQ
ncbi:hypothetical protein Sgly_0753 [Syntrophobotulus glycolicus DSM 8271]|uniref:Uncharacterized protein n=1 Tax=Syntrophobotulus glycolicus (strain DSM 8271 / FlGlyR) TaxID=645991 RepID=F0T0P5_SYNGF|nr:hypothetical protein [Syntrophobotulus glycolicus]ADY55110.1 hypothetical protein Sgly_0753 [Syntrophobotulus glycolicus DSM 8271]